MYHVAVILTDAQKRIVWVNDDFTKITGYSLTEARGKKPGILLQGPETEQEAVMRIRQGLNNLTSFKEVITNYRKNGEKYPCKLIVHPIFDDRNQLVNYIAFEVDGDQVRDDSVIPLMQLEERYQSSSLRGVEEMRLFTRVQQLMENEMLYLDPNLSLKQLAEQLETNTKYLSQVINHFSGSNFQQYLNAYRINRFTSELNSGNFRHLTLFGLAQYCGFINKSTFFKVFKEMLGETPKSYMAKMSLANHN